MSYDYETYRRLTETSSARHISEEKWKELTFEYDRRSVGGYSLIALMIAIMAMFFGILIVKSAPEKVQSAKDVIYAIISVGWIAAFPLYLLFRQRNKYKDSYEPETFCGVGKAVEDTAFLEGNYHGEPCYEVIEFFGGNRKSDGSYAFVKFDEDLCPPSRFKVLYERPSGERLIETIRKYYGTPQGENPNDDNVYIIFRFKDQELTAIGFCDYEPYIIVTGRRNKRARYRRVDYFNTRK